MVNNFDVVIVSTCKVILATNCTRDIHSCNCKAFTMSHHSVRNKKGEFVKNGVLTRWAYGVVVSMFDFHRSDRGSNPSRGSKIS